MGKVLASTLESCMEQFGVWLLSYDVKLIRGRSKMTSAQKLTPPLPPLSPFVTIFGLPPPSHVTGVNGDKLLAVKGWRKK